MPNAEFKQNPKWGSQKIYNEQGYGPLKIIKLGRLRYRDSQIGAPNIMDKSSLDNIPEGKLVFHDVNEGYEEQRSQWNEILFQTLDKKEEMKGAVPNKRDTRNQ